MYYVLFSYKASKQGERSWRDFENDAAVISFLHQFYEKIDVLKIIEVKAEYHLGLSVTEEHIKSTLEPEEETESLVPIGKDMDEAILKEKKRKLKELEAEPEAELGTEEELTPEQKTQKAIDDADGLIEREKKREEQRKKGWGLCTKCNSNGVAPWNKKKICSPCQGERKTTRPYSNRSKEFAGL